ncbi:MAG: DUF1822 family protein [Cyanobacteria bacterium J06627_28]
MFSPPASTDDNSFPILINQEMKQLATHFADQQPNKHYALRVYRNTLAVSVVNRYLQMLGIKTDLPASDSWNPALRLVNDVADLVTPKGRLECRPIDKTAENCYIPLDVQCDRLAYIVVRLNSPQEASILGFVGQSDAIENSLIESEHLPLRELRLLSELPYYLAQVQTVVHLRQWLEEIYQQSWQAPHTLLQPQQLALSNSQANVQRAKLIQLDLHSEHSDAVLLLALSIADTATLSTELIETYPITVKAQLYPAIAQQKTVNGLRFLQSSADCLLPDIKLSIHAAHSSLSREVISRAYPRDNCIQIPQFQGELGERFTLTISVGDQHIEEQFQL